VVELRDVRLAFGEKEILKGVTFLVERGETLVVMGASGVGKSTVLRLVLGILQPDAGSVVVAGVDMGGATPEEAKAVRDRIGMVFQAGALFDSLTVGENVGFRLQERGELSDEEIAAEVVEKLSFVDLDPEVADLMPAELSGGMRKRVGIARALASEPEMLLFDEPTAGLDPTNARMVGELIVQLRSGVCDTAVVVTHDLELARTVADRVAILIDGRFAALGTLESVESSEDPAVQAFLAGEARVSP
jgi:phospholipid/cholesterol/gamma-HCH transport system ATP-binding protein